MEGEGACKNLVEIQERLEFTVDCWTKILKMIWVAELMD